MASIAVQRPRPLQEWLYRNRDKALAALAFASIFIIITPALWLVITSFKTNDNIFRFPPQLIPNPFTFENYTEALSGGDFPRYLLNSIIVTGISTALCVLFSALAAYALTFFKFVGRRALLLIIVGTQFFPAAILLLPLFRMGGTRLVQYLLLADCDVHRRFALAMHLAAGRLLQGDPGGGARRRDH